MVRSALAALLILLATTGAAAATTAGAAAASTKAAARTGVRHVFVIVLENESASTTFGAKTPAPYLAKTLTAQGAYLPNYYGVGHHSNDDYIAMVSGQAPNLQNMADCPLFDNFHSTRKAAYGQQTGTGCVYPADIPTVASQLTTAHLTWKGYNEDMGADPHRESATCGHPAIGHLDLTELGIPSDMYATRHNPFVYFHSVIDNAGLCRSHVVNLNQLPHDLAKVSTTPNYAFITPDLCDDGHDSPCANGQRGGLAQADRFLRTWVPRITHSPAFRRDGLLVVTFDEAESSDTGSCCHEIPGPGAKHPGVIGPGGGRVGAVALSPCIAPHTVVKTPYNHYTLLGSVENIFGLKHLGYAGLPHETYFGSAIFNRKCGSARSG